MASSSWKKNQQDTQNKTESGKKGRARDLQEPLNLSLLSTPSCSPSRCDLSRPSNYSNERLRAEEEEAEREGEGGGGGGGGGCACWMDGSRLGGREGGMEEEPFITASYRRASSSEPVGGLKGHVGF